MTLPERGLLARTAARVLSVSVEGTVVVPNLDVVGVVGQFGALRMPVLV